MNFSTQNLTDSDQPILRFEPRTSDEKITARVIRMMLNFEVMRVQLEGGRPDLTEYQRHLMHEQAIQVRCLGFRTEREAINAKVPLSYDPDLLRREGIRIAYLLARKAFHLAMLVEKEVITLCVSMALYGIDEDYISMTRAA